VISPVACRIGRAYLEFTGLAYANLGTHRQGEAVARALGLARPAERR
jgi:hypothetical protein